MPIGNPRRLSCAPSRRLPRRLQLLRLPAPHRLLTNPRAPPHPLPTRLLCYCSSLFSYLAAAPPPPTPHIPPHRNHLPIPPRRLPTSLPPPYLAPCPHRGNGVRQWPGISPQQRHRRVVVSAPSLELSLSTPALVAPQPFLFLDQRLAVMVVVPSLVPAPLRPVAVASNKAATYRDDEQSDTRSSSSVVDDSPVFGVGLDLNMPPLTDLNTRWLRSRHNSRRSLELLLLARDLSVSVVVISNVELAALMEHLMKREWAPHVRRGLIGRSFAIAGMVDFLVEGSTNPYMVGSMSCFAFVVVCWTWLD